MFFLSRKRRSTCCCKLGLQWTLPNLLLRTRLRVGRFHLRVLHGEIYRSPHDLKCTTSYENYSNTENTNPMRQHKEAFYGSLYHEKCQELTPGISVLHLLFNNNSTSVT